MWYNIDVLKRENKRKVGMNMLVNVNKKKFEFRLDQVATGMTFEYEGQFFIKIHPVHDFELGECNVLCLSDGHAYPFREDCLVGAVFEEMTLTEQVIL